MNNVTAITVQHTDKKVKAMLNLYIWNIRMPMLMRFQRLFKTFTHACWVISFLLQHSCFLQNTIHRVRAGISNVFVNHHIGTAPKTITTVCRGERDDCLLLPFEHSPIELVWQSISLSPGNEFFLIQTEFPAKLGVPQSVALLPMTDEINDLITNRHRFPLYF